MLRLLAWLTAVGGGIATLWKGLPFVRWARDKLASRWERHRQFLLLVEDVSALVMISSELVSATASNAEWRHHVEEFTAEQFDRLDRQLHRVGRRLNVIESTMKEHA